MYHVRGVCHVDFDGAKLSLFPYFSRHSLMQSRALKMLLEVLEAAHLIYRLRFPFCLSVTKDGHQVTLRHKTDLPQFLSHLGLASVDILDWVFLLGDSCPGSLTAIATGAPLAPNQTPKWLRSPCRAEFLFLGNILSVFDFFCSFVLLDHYTHPEGRFVFLKGTMFECKLTLVLVYAPNTW